MRDTPFELHTEGDKVTMKQVCEYIEVADILHHPVTGYAPSAKEIFEYSSTGELYMIGEWFELAKQAEECLN